MEESPKYWERPASTPVPTVWRRCEGRRQTPEGKTLRFRIQDVPEDRHEDLLDFMIKYFTPDEPTMKKLKLYEDAGILEFLRGLYGEFLTQNLSLVAFLEEDEGELNKNVRPRIVGANLLAVAYKNEKFELPKNLSETVKKATRFWLDYIPKKFDSFEHYGVDHYLSGYGLCVLREFRGQGLGLEILKARFDLAKAVGLEVTVTSFTNISSQILAARVGFEEHAEIVYEEYKDDDGVVLFTDMETRSLKIMGKRVVLQGHSVPPKCHAAPIINALYRAEVSALLVAGRTNQSHLTAACHNTTCPDPRKEMLATTHHLRGLESLVKHAQFTSPSVADHGRLKMIVSILEY
uniref:N-acetyltransferase domain-containing protein n=1 Tax=Timema douglasi TaxID=61478 RepID=A0A7R8Z9L5_TIMDO|nr:unnamed protein product [Timema douglasi]